jgi:hypothetical protein
MESALTRLFTNVEPALSKLETIMAGADGGNAPAGARRLAREAR